MRLPAIYAVILAILASASTGLAANPADELPLDPRTRTGTLDNGLRYFIRENKEPRDRAELRLAVNAGSILEDDDQLGLAHFLEHMAFNGTKNFEAQELIDYLETIGMRFGPDINAYTSFDETVYMLTVPTDDQIIVQQAFQILEDWAHGITLDPEEVDKERGVVVEEWRSGRGAGQRLRDKQLPVMFEGSLYAERLPIGKKEIIESAPPQALSRFYRDWYRPDLMGVVAIGDFDADEIETLIRHHFSRLNNPDGERERFYSEVPGHSRTRFALATDPEARITRARVYVTQPPRPIVTVGDFRESMIESLYFGMFNQRLRELTQSAEPPFVNAFAGRRDLTRTIDAYALSVVVEEGGIDDGLQAALTEVARVLEYGFTQPELDRQRARLLSGLERQYNEREKTNSAAYAAARVSHFLQDSPVPGIEYVYELNNELIPGITLDEVNAIRPDWFNDENRIVLADGPEKEGVTLPESDEFLAVFAAVEAAPIQPYSEELSEAPLVSRLAPPGSIETEESIDEIELHAWTLSNGVRVLLKSTEFKEDQIILSGYSPGGASLADDDDFLSAEMASFIVGQSGAGDFNRIDLSKRLAGKIAGVSPFIGNLREGIRGSSTPKDLETMFQLVYLYFTEPRRDEETFESLKSRLAAVLENRAADPNAAYSDSVSLTLAQYHPRAWPLTVDEIGNIDLDVAYDFYRDRFADASDFTFVLVGNLDLTTVRPLVAQYLGALPSTKREETWRDLDIRPPTGVVEKSFKKGIADKSQTSIIFTGSFEWNRANRYALQSMVDALRIRLREVLREDLGGTYGVSITGSRQRIPTPEYQVQVSFGCEPQRLEELSGEVFRIVREIQQDGIDGELVAKIQEAQRRDVEEGLRQNGYWLAQISFRDQHDIDQLEVLGTDEVIDSLNSGVVQDAANLYLNGDNYIQVSMYPEDS